MDLVRELRDVRFQVLKRGYDCDAVDVFLAMIRAEVADLQTRTAAAESRVGVLEDQLSGDADAEGTLRRTLVLAQRLADETVAEAKQEAAELVANAEAEAAEMRAGAEAEVDKAREDARLEVSGQLEQASQTRAEAEEFVLRERETAAHEAADVRAKALASSEQLIAASEIAGRERVSAIEAEAVTQLEDMRNSVRVEVEALETTRSSLSGDVTALEDHLADQRARVRAAVEALRVGMSGSIQDLERVADDEELLRTAERPELSGASLADVQPGPEVSLEISDPALSPEAVAATLAAEVDEAEEVASPDATGDLGESDTWDPEATQPLEAVASDEVDDTSDIDIDSDADEEAGWEPRETVAPQGVDDSLAIYSSDVVALDADDSPLFEQDMAAEATSSTVIDVPATETVADDIDIDTDDIDTDAAPDGEPQEANLEQLPPPPLAASTGIDLADNRVRDDLAGPQTGAPGAFLQRLSLALDDVPIGGNA